MTAISHFISKSPFIKNLRDVMRGLRMSPRTEDAYVHYVADFLSFNGLKKNPGQLDVNRYLAHLAKMKRSAGTIRVASCALNLYFSRVLKKPLPLIEEIGPLPVKVPDFLSSDDVDKLFAEMDGEMKLLAQLAYGTGMKLSELIRLKTHNVIFVTGSIITDGRVIAIPNSLRDALRAQVDRVHPPGHCDVWLWPSRKTSTNHLHPSSFQQALARASKKAGLRRVSPQLLRHSHAVAMLQSGYSVESVAGRLGINDATAYFYCLC